MYTLLLSKFTPETQILLTKIIVPAATAMGTVSTLDSIEQIGRVILMVLTIISVTLLIIINFGKALKIIQSKKRVLVKKLKGTLEKCDDENIYD